MSPNPTADPDAIAPVFVVGAMRSGTTLLRLMLNEHPDLAIPAESHFLGPLFDHIGPTARLVGPTLERALAIVLGRPEWQRDFAATEAELRAALGAGPWSMAEFIDRVFRLEVGPEPARWGDKTPQNLLWADDLLACFPAGQIIAIVRDPRDVALSIAPYGWAGETAWDIGRYVARNGRLVTECRARLAPERFTVVRYEDLVLQTEDTLRQVCEFLALPFAAAMEAFFVRAEHHIQAWERDLGVHEKLLRPPEPSDVGRWRREGSARAHAVIEALTTESVDAFGYERRIDRRLVPAARLAARAAHHARSPGELVRRTTTRLRRRIRAVTSRA